ncbi:unnamed protein product [Medioppia subpectinata]|uniref:Uncharacterized protein n=1 Tax=Medioppia subpectinata TaxID=1979941 RepID=A0A7R9KX35_9ACAR|nr:unnamed protein product [Medioppia subpectinata]CAG2110337.1 unnamed protein product [Medioppia subpectinata]
MRQSLSAATDDKTRKLLDGFVGSFAPKITQYYTKFEQQLGGIDDDVKHRALDESVIDYQLMVMREMKRGSLLRMILLKMVSDWRIQQLRAYLKSQALYRPTALSNNLLYMDFDVSADVNISKTIIDSIAANITAAEDQELIQLARDEKELIDKFYVYINTNVKLLSDRVVEPLADFMAKMFTTDYVQKILMTGEMTTENIQFGRNFWIRTKDLIMNRIGLLKKCQSVAADEKSRKMLDELIRTLTPRMTQIYATFEQQLGGVGDDLKHRGMDETTADYHLLTYREIKRGSFARMMLLYMLPVWRNLKLQEYIKSQPKYRPSVLSNQMMFMDLDMKSLMNKCKNIIDINTEKISAADEQELIQLANETMILDAKFYSTIPLTIGQPISTVSNDRSISISTNYSGKQLSDRVVETLADSMAKRFTTDYVQKTLMMGEMSDENIKIGQGFWKSRKVMDRLRIELIRKCQSVATDDNTRKLLDGLAGSLVPKMRRFYSKFEQQLGGVGDDVKHRAMDDTLIDYQHMVLREMKRGSIVRMMLLKMLPSWRTLQLRAYLKSQPLYRPTPLSDNLLFMDFDLSTNVNIYKTIIESNAANITAAEERELIQLVNEENELNEKVYLSINA